VSRLVMHIGLEKTGSTYLQAFLRDNAALLAEQGVGYPDFCRGPEHLEFYMAGLPEIGWMHRRFEIRTPEKLEELRTRVRAGLERMASTYETSVVTSERLSIIRDPAALASIAALSRDYFDQVDVVAYLRRPDHAVGSYYGQSVKVGLTSRAVPDFMGHQGRSLDLAAIVARWQDAFGADSVFAWPYLERYKSGGDTALGVFFRHVGLTPPTPEDPGPWKRPGRPINVRLSAEATEYVRLLNPRVPRWRVDGRWNGPMRNLLLEEVSARFPGKDAAAPPDILQAIIDAYPAADIAALARRSEDPDVGLWDEWLAQPTATGEEPPVISDAQVAELARELLAPRGPILADGAVPRAPLARRVRRQARRWRRKVRRAIKQSSST
jgi:hypothetical protein